MQQLLISIGLPIALILIMIGVGLSLTLRDFERVLTQPKSFLVGACCQMFVLPLCAIIIIYLTGLSGELAAGLFILSLCPGGTTSNLYSYLAKADVGLSVSLTAIIGFITPFTMPILSIWAIEFYTDTNKQVVLPLLPTWVKLMVITVLPILVGMWVRNKFLSFAVKAQPYISAFSVSVLFMMILSICVKLGPMLINYLIMAGPATLGLNFITMLIGFLAGHYLLKHQAQSRTITLEVGLQNGTLALLITSGMLQNTTMSIAPSIYSLVMFISASAFIALIKTKRFSRTTNY